MDSRHRPETDIITRPPSASQMGRLSADSERDGVEKTRHKQAYPQRLQPITHQHSKRRFGLLHRASNRLWVRLSLAFTTIAFLSAASILLIMMFAPFARNESTNNLLEALQRPGGTVDQLANFYHNRGSWYDVEPFLSGLQSSFPDTPQYNVSFSLIDAEDRPVVSLHPAIRGRVAPVTLNRTLTIWGDDDLIVGRLQVLQIGAPGIGASQAIFLSWLNKWWLPLTLAGVIIGLVFGIIVSRSLASPFSDMAQVAQKIGARDWASRIDVRGTSEITELAQALNQMAQDLEQGEMLRRNLVADVAHELRTPLTVLQGSLRALIDGVYPMETKEIANLYDQTLVLRRLVTDLHELSLVESRAMVLNRQPINVAEFIARIVSSFEPVAEERQIRIMTEIPPRLPIVRVDPPRIAQVLNNVLDNALRHTPPGGRVILKVFRTEEHLGIEIGDTGQGIDPEHLPYIFERFYRADRARARHTGGSGLGLAIARAIIEAHGGTITIDSEGLGKGTTACIMLSVPTRPIIPHDDGR